MHCRRSSCSTPGRSWGGCARRRRRRRCAGACIGVKDTWSAARRGWRYGHFGKSFILHELNGRTWSCNACTPALPCLQEQHQHALSSQAKQLAVARSAAAEHARDARSARQALGAAEAQLAQRAQQAQQLERIRQKNLHRITEFKRVGGWGLVSSRLVWCCCLPPSAKSVWEYSRRSGWVHPTLLSPCKDLHASGD